MSENAVSHSEATPGTGNDRIILVIDDAPFCRELVTAALRGRGYTALSAADGYQGLELLAAHPVEIVVLDYRMPRMSGTEVLKHMRADPRWANLPVIMLTDSAQKEVVVEAGSLGITGYMLKTNFSLPELLSRVEKSLNAIRPTVAAESTAANASTKSASMEKDKLTVPNLVSHDATLAAITDQKGLKSLQGISSELTTAIAANEASVQRMVGLIKQDAVFAARLLSAANSAESVKVRIHSLEEATKAVGLDGIKKLIAEIQPLDAFVPGKPDAIDLLRCWQHGLAMAAMMARIVPKTDATPTGLLYLVGLSYNLVQIVLRQRFAAEFAAAIDFASHSSTSVMTACKGVFGIGYADLTKEFTQRWKLPSRVFDPIAELAAQEEAYANGARPRALGLLARATSIASHFANGLQLGPLVNSTVAPVLQAECRMALIPCDKINAAEIRTETMMTVAMDAALSPDDERRFCEQLIRHRLVKVWYARNQAFAALDPLEAALRLMCEVDVHDRMPHGNELASISGVIVAAPSADAPEVAEAHRLHRQAGSDIQILCIVPPDGSPVGNESISYPVQMSRLGQFVKILKTR
ncbi:MAG TPA: HDOD domain-containing protein [Tepidisphaeraceae bacterium]|nr:HDOD domain-containing protein [Tepidisphaeraceae bacterium]